MAENLAGAKAKFDVLQRQLEDASILVESLEKNFGGMDGQSSMSSVPLSTIMVGTVMKSYLVIFFYFMILPDLLLSKPCYSQTCRQGILMRVRYRERFEFR